MRCLLTLLSFAVVSMPMNAEETVDLNRGLVGHWTFDESDGQKSADLSINKIDAVLSEGTSHCPGKFGGAIQCDGATGSIRIAANPKLDASDRTISMWANIESVNAHAFSDLLWQGSGGKGCLLRFKHGAPNLQLRVDRKTGGSLFAVDQKNHSVYFNKWHHFAGTMDSKAGIARLFVDGELVAEAKGNPGSAECGGEIRLMSAGEGAIKGKVDELRLYDRALSAAEIKVLSSETNLEAGLVGHWDFDELEGSRAMDSSGHDQHGTIIQCTRETGRFIGGLRFDGKNTAVEIADSPLLKFKAGITLSAWVRSQSWGSQPDNLRIIHKRHICLILLAGQRLRFSVSPELWIETPLPASGDWHHFVATYDGSFLRLYSDGKMLDEKPGKGPIDECGDPLFFGTVSRTESQIYRFNGVMDEVRIYNRGLSKDDIGGLFSFVPLLSPKIPNPLPEVILAGTPLQHKIYNENFAKSFEIVEGPKEASVTPAGILKWTPSPNDTGVHALRIKASVDGQNTIAPLKTRVVTKEMAAAVNGDLEKLKEVGIHTVKAGNFVEPACTNEIIVLDEKNVKILDSEGQIAVTSLTLEKAYKKVFARKDYLVGLTNNTIDLIDRKTGKLNKSIDLKAGGTNDLAIDPQRPVSWVAIVDTTEQKASKLGQSKIARVDETTGALKTFPQVLGSWILIHPSGNLLFAAFRDMQQGLFDYINVDIVMSYDVSGGVARPLHVNKSPGANGQNFRMSPDGKYVSYMAGGGYRSGAANMNGYTIPAFSTQDIRLAKAAYDVGPYPSDMAYHPYLPIVVANSMFYELESGAKIESPVDLQGESLHEMSRNFFSPGGKSYICCYKDKSGRKVVRAFPLKLSDKDRQLIEKGAQERKAAPAIPVPIADPEPPARPAPKEPANKPIKEAAGTKLKASALNVLQDKPQKAELKKKEIARQFKNAVVILETEDGGGTGFFVGATGYIISCAHVLPELGSVAVRYRVDQNGETKAERTGEVEVIASDRDMDIALLKIKTAERVKTVVFGGEKTEMGESICVIGHPGLGTKVLDYTMSEGIVSNAERAFNDRRYIQTTAAVNPGSSGGPVFDERGNVIGMIVIKAHLDGVGFAVPADEIRSFLKAHLED